MSKLDTFTLTNVGLVSPSFDTTRVMYNENVLFFHTRRVWVFEDYFVLIPFMSICHATAFIPRWNYPRYGIRIVLIQLTIRVYKDPLISRYPPNINIQSALQCLYPRIGSLIPLMVLIIDSMHSPIHQSNIGSNICSCTTPEATTQNYIL